MPELLRNQRNLGEALKAECPKNDCIVYRNVYEMFTELEADREKVMGIVSDQTIRVIERAMLAHMKTLNDMFFDNYAVKKYREERGL